MISELWLCTCDADGISLGGFRWDLTIGAVNEAPVWDPNEYYRYGLYGLPWGVGNWKFLDREATWVVFEPKGERTGLSRGTAKCQGGIVCCVGDRDDALTYLEDHGVAEGFNTLARDPEPETRLWIAEHPFMIPEILELLAHDPNEGVRAAVAGHWKTTAETLEVLAHDPEKSVREAVASHASTSVQTLEFLAQDLDWHVRFWTARHHSITPELLTDLAHDLDVGVRSCVALHPSTTPETLELLAQDEDPWIRGWALMNQKRSSQIDCTQET